MQLFFVLMQSSFVVRLLMSFCHDQIDFKATIVADVYKYVSNADL